MHQLMKLGFPVLCIDRLSQIESFITAVQNWIPGEPFPDNIGATIPGLDVAALPSNEGGDAT